MSGDITLTRSELELIVSRAVAQALQEARKDVPVEVAEVARDTLVDAGVDKPRCAGKRRDGHACDSPILVGTTGFCKAHQGQAFREPNKAKRARKAGKQAQASKPTGERQRDLAELKGLRVGETVPVTRTRKEVNRALHYVGYKKLAQDGKVFTYTRDDGRSLVWDRSAKAITLKA